MHGLFNIFVIVSFLAICAITIIGIPIVILYCILVFVGAKKRAIKADKRLSSTLMDGEAVITKALQLRPYALLRRRMMVAITDSRVILLRRGLLGGFDMEDIQWKDLRDVRMSENILSGICGANLVFHYVRDSGRYKKDDEEGEKHEKFKVHGTPVEEASRIYSRAQSEEQAWEEKRRIRGIEEKRAAAGGVVVNSSREDGHQGSQTRDNTSFFEEIEKAKKIRDDGTISDAEFEEIKSKILSRNY